MGVVDFRRSDTHILCSILKNSCTLNGYEICQILKIFSLNRKVLRGRRFLFLRIQGQGNEGKWVSRDRRSLLTPDLSVYANLTSYNVITHWPPINHFGGTRYLLLRLRVSSLMLTSFGLSLNHHLYPGVWCNRKRILII